MPACSNRDLYGVFSSALLPSSPSATKKKSTKAKMVVAAQNSILVKVVNILAFLTVFIDHAMLIDKG